MGPFSPFQVRSSDRRLVRLPSSAGIAPVRGLKEMVMWFRLERLPSSDGSAPVNPLTWRNISSRLARLPSSGGISPLRLLTARSRISRLISSPSSGGIGPVSSLCWRDRYPQSGKTSKFRRYSAGQSLTSEVQLRDARRSAFDGNAVPLRYRRI